MIFKHKKAILFDLDGTLIDSVPDLASALNRMLTLLDYPTYDETQIRAWVGNGAQILVKRGLSGSVIVDETLDTGLVAKALELFLKLYTDKVCVNTTLYPKVRETLDILKYEEYLLAIVTNKPYRFVEPILQTLGLESLFTICVGGDTLIARKPDPMPLHYVCEKLGVKIEEALMVGDSKNDILAAKAAKMECVGVTYGYNYGEAISVYEPHAVVSNLIELLALMQKRSVKNNDR